MDASDAHAALQRCSTPDELCLVRELARAATLPEATLDAIARRVESVVVRLRAGAAPTPLQRLLDAFPIDTPEGLALMTLAEALLRVPDRATGVALIRDAGASLDWRHAPGHDASLLAEGSAAMLAAVAGVLAEPGGEALDGRLRRTLARGAGPLIFRLMRRLVRSGAAQFVFAGDVAHAVSRMGRDRNTQTRYSLDMLGEAALSAGEAEGYLRRYAEAVEVIGRAGVAGAEISVKLSALCPRFEVGQWDRAESALVAGLEGLLEGAVPPGVGLTIDAEESERLELSLAVFRAVLTRGAVASGRAPPGIAVQAYSPRALAVLDFLNGLGRSLGARIPVRLVKGAYWDSEIKRAQVGGWQRYPVFTAKVHTDLSYLACARRLLRECDYLEPRFATHNLTAIYHVLALAADRPEVEFQRLFGMGEALYQRVLEEEPRARCRVYAPVGEAGSLMAYLVRRLLENGANSSFVQQLGDAGTAEAELAEHPLRTWRRQVAARPPPPLPLPADLFGAARRNSPGINLAVGAQRAPLLEGIEAYRDRYWEVHPLVPEHRACGIRHPVLNPATGCPVGSWRGMDAAAMTEALDRARGAWGDWRRGGVAERCRALERFAGLLEARRTELLALLVLEAGKTVPDAIDEWREALDFTRYYAQQAAAVLGKATRLPGPVGESNTLGWRPRGVFLCVSPWNFPLAIFCGQVTAALAAGNAVLAKPAEDTPIIASRVVELLREAGFPPPVVQLWLVGGAELGRWLASAWGPDGVAFTGSTATAHAIHRCAAASSGPITPLIAETGGVNAMIVDSTALPEQVVRDVLGSAFNSAGQRCSALRVLYLQRDVHDDIVDRLGGALAMLQMGDPMCLATDLGPVINARARERLEAHVERMETLARWQLGAGQAVAPGAGFFVAPRVFGVSSLAAVGGEHFGPLLHVVSYARGDLERVVADINGCGYGLTLGIQSRNLTWARALAQRLEVGNVYLNRGMTGAVVGVQPFGGRGLSGTGFKAGGPHYLYRFASEVAVSENTAALGGNASLLMRAKPRGRRS